MVALSAFCADRNRRFRIVTSRKRSTKVWSTKILDILLTYGKGTGVKIVVRLLFVHDAISGQVDSSESPGLKF